MSAIFTQFAASIVSIDASMFTNESPVYRAWNIFRNIGNIALVIILIIIIVSQLTGFGIDNYGIKKTLPKLIVSVVLMNFSFTACQAIIDLSNILGKGIIGLGHEITNNMDGVGFSGGAESFVAIISSVLGGTAAGVTAGAGEAITIASLAAGLGVEVGGGPIIIAAIVLAILPVILALILFFFMLAVRKIGIIACVVVSPLAIVCQVIPGTQSLFKRWIKLFEAMLIVYPICGGLLALSHLVRHIGMTLGGVHIGMIMIGVIAEFSPFFLAPSLIKKSIGGIGNVFNKASSLGKNAIAKGRNSLQNTSAYKNQLEAGKVGMGKKFNDNQMKKRFDKAGLTAKYGNYDKLVRQAKSGDKDAKKDLENFARRNRSTVSRRDDFMKRQAQLESGTIAAAYGATEDAYDAASREGIFNAENKAMEQDKWNSEFMTGVEMVDEDGTKKEYVYNKATDTFQNGNEIVRRGSDKYGRLYGGMGQNKVKVGDQEYERDGEGWRRTDTHAEATEKERKKIDDKLATTSAIRRNYMKGSDGVFRDASGGRELTNESISGIRPQTYSDLKHTEAAQGRQADVWKTAGANAGYSQDDLTRSAAVNAENSAISQTNSTIGKSDAITMMQDVGYSTQTSQIASSQTEAAQIINTSSKNVSAGNIAATLSSTEQAQLRQAIARNGGIEAIINDSSSSPVLLRAAKQIQAEYSNIGGAALNDSQRLEIKNAAESGGLDAIINGAGYTDMQKNIAKKLALSSILASPFAPSDVPDVLLDSEISNIQSGLLRQQQESAANNIVKSFADSAATLGYDGIQLQQAVTTGAVRLDNQHLSETSKNKVGEIRISHDYADNLERQRFDINQEKIYDEGFKLVNKDELLDKLRNIDTDPNFAKNTNYRRSLIKNIMAKGGEDDMIQFAIDHKRTNDPRMEAVYDEFYSTSEDRILKEYGKFINSVKEKHPTVDIQTLPTFEQWSQGSYELQDNNGGTISYDDGKKANLEAYIKEQGEKVLANASKSFMKILNKNPNIANQFNGSQLLYGMTESRDSAVQAEVRKLVAGKSVQERSNIISNASDSQLTSLTESDWIAMITGDTNGDLPESINDGNIVAEIRNSLAKAAKSLKNAKSIEHMPPNIREFLGV